MLSLPKKNPDKAAAASTPAWHPNFRNFAQLPDTKHVRTSFFVNGVAVVVAGIFLLLFVYQEYRLAESRQQLKNWEQQIERDRPNSAKAVALFKKFQDEEKKDQGARELSGQPADQDERPPLAARRHPAVRRHDRSDRLLRKGNHHSGVAQGHGRCPGDRGCFELPIATQE